MYNYYEVFHRLVHYLSTTFFFLLTFQSYKTKTLFLNIKYPLGHFIVLPLSMSFQTHPQIIFNKKKTVMEICCISYFRI